jgi:ATP-binding cassette subfamily C protein
MNDLVKLLSLFTARERLAVAGLLALMVLASTLEVLSIGLLLPYLALLQDPRGAESFQVLALASKLAPAASYQALCVGVSGALLALFLAKAVYMIWLQKTQMRFVLAKQARLGERLLASYLYGPYAFFLGANTSTLIANLTTSLGQLAGGVLQSTLALATEAAILAGLLGLLIYLDPPFSLAAALGVAALALLHVRALRPRIAFYARENDLRWKEMMRAANEALNSAKELQVLGRQDYYVRRYTEEFQKYSAAVQKYNILLQLPRALLESAVVVGMVVFGTFALLSGRFQQDLFPILAVFAVAAIRLVPSVTRILQAWSAIAFYAPSIHIVRQGLDQPRGSPPASADTSTLALREALELHVSSFRYPGDTPFRLHDIHFSVRRGEAIGLIGRSGSGKTSLVDVLLGLFPDFDGELRVDGRDVRGDLARWRARLGYIPQSIYLADDTVLRNIAFGVPDASIDPARALRAAQLAGLQEVIANLPLGLAAVVGERGVRLSGGERQRIGIARALYHDPDVLVMDEATSALDNEIERAIVDSILGLTPGKTVIIIAHRLSTVRNCDRLYLMREGAVVDQGRFDELARRHPDFVNPQPADPASSPVPLRSAQA